MLRVMEKGAVALLVAGMALPLAAGDVYEYERQDLFLVAPEPEGMRAMYGLDPELDPVLESMYPAKGGEMLDAYLGVDENEQITDDNAFIGYLPGNRTSVSEVRDTARQTIKLFTSWSIEELNERQEQTRERLKEASGSEIEIEVLSSAFLEGTLQQTELGTTFGLLVLSRGSFEGEPFLSRQYRQLYMFSVDDTMVMAVMIVELDPEEEIDAARARSVAWIDALTAANLPADSTAD